MKLKLPSLKLLCFVLFYLFAFFIGVNCQAGWVDYGVLWFSSPALELSLCTVAYLDWNTSDIVLEFNSVLSRLAAVQSVLEIVSTW